MLEPALGNLQAWKSNPSRRGQHAMRGLPAARGPAPPTERTARITLPFVPTTRSRLASILVIPLCLTLLVACGGEDAEVATEVPNVPEVTPGASYELPEGIEIATVEITGGSFGVEELLLQQDQPTVLEIVNNDDEEYTLRIGNLVGDTLIPAGTSVEIEFTTPTAETYEASLLAANTTVLATMRVIVQAPGAVEP